MSDIDFVQLFLVFTVLILSLTVHEAAHAFTADRLGDPTARLLGRLSLNPAVHIDPIGTILLPLVAAISHVPIIGWAKPVPVNLRNLQHGRRDFMLVAAAGPASNVAMACVCAAILTVVPAATFDVDTAPSTRVVRGLFELGLSLNVLLALFNMIPIPPLDGGNVLAGVLPAEAAALFDRLRPFGFLIIYALMLTGVLGAAIGPVYGMVVQLLGGGVR